MTFVSQITNKIAQVFFFSVFILYESTFNSFGIYFAIRNRILGILASSLNFISKWLVFSSIHLLNKLVFNHQFETTFIKNKNLKCI